MKQWEVVRQDYVAAVADGHGLIEAEKVFLKKPNGSLILYHDGYQRHTGDVVREAEKVVAALNQAKVLCEERTLAGKL